MNDFPLLTNNTYYWFLWHTLLWVEISMLSHVCIYIYIHIFFKWTLGSFPSHVLSAIESLLIKNWFHWFCVVQQKLVENEKVNNYSEELSHAWRLPKLFHATGSYKITLPLNFVCVDYFIVVVRVTCMFNTFMWKIETCWKLNYL